MRRSMQAVVVGGAVALALALPARMAAQEAGTADELDARVRAFLDARRSAWRDMNVPAADGQRLYDLVRTRGFTRALEVGTSTGHSAIWIAWALSKTGGTLVTIEIDEARYREALANFEAAGLSRFIDARLADAHTLVPELDGPFDFVFQDADKDWYARYFELIYPKMTPRACYVAHNVSTRRSGSNGAFLDALAAKTDLVTEIVGGGRSGMSISCRPAH